MIALRAALRAGAMSRRRQGAAPGRANQRGAARLAAVQALYQMDLGGATLPEVLAEFESYRLGKEVDGEQYRDADAAFFRDIVTGVVRDQRELDPAIHARARRRTGRCRASTRRSARSSAPAPTSSAAGRDVPARVVITEYVDVAKAFFDAEVPGMVNGVLDALAHVSSGRPSSWRRPRGPERWPARRRGDRANSS